MSESSRGWVGGRFLLLVGWSEGGLIEKVFCLSG